MNYDIHDDDLRRTSRENYGTGLEIWQPSVEEKSYKVVGKQIQFLMNNDTCMKKKYNEWWNNTKWWIVEIHMHTCTQRWT